MGIMTITCMGIIGDGILYFIYGVKYFIIFSNCFALKEKEDLAGSGLGLGGFDGGSLDVPFCLFAFMML